MPCVMWAQPEGTDLGQDSAIMGPPCYLFCPPGPPLPIFHTLNVCVSKALLPSTDLSLVCPFNNLGSLLSFIPSLGSK